MNLRTLWAATLALTLASGTLAPVAAEASRVVDTTVSGRVADIRGGDTLVINGKSYRVLSGSPAAKTLGQLHIGQVVELVLNGEPGNEATRVVVIHSHEQP